jgi:raffinose/stachyose/melibiose transport system permease protein
MLKTGRLTPYLYILPAVILLLFTFGYPLVSVFYFSMHRIRGISGPFIGFENYLQVFKDVTFRLAAQHNLQLLVAVPVMTVIALILAVLLHERVKGWEVYRTIQFAPYILAIPVVGIVFNNILQLNGILNEGLRTVGLGFLAGDWLGNADLALWSVMGVIIWREVGFGIVLFQASLLGLNEELLDAAHIDGAGWWQRLFYVTIPQLAAVIEFFVVVSVINMLAWVFGFIYVMTKGGPGSSTQVMEFYIYNYAFRNSLPGIASAVAVILFLVTCLMIIPLFRANRPGRAGEGS